METKGVREDYSARQDEGVAKGGVFLPHKVGPGAAPVNGHIYLPL